jgi:bis(5'-nucleosyl)-tetraphosphatase (symmetrical)
MATYAIGDVQGCFATLLQLLDTLGFHRDRDQLWFAGDLVNRGPHSLEVLRFVRDLGDRALTVLGNHDLHLLAVAHGQTRVKPKDTFTDVLEAPDRDALLTWLRHRPLLHHDVALGVTLVHAGLPPQWTPAVAQACAAEAEVVLRGPSYLECLRRIADNDCSHWSATLRGWEKFAYVLNCLTQLRYCDAAGRLALGAKGPPGTQSPPYLPWFALPQRAHVDHTILFGHWATLGAYTAPGIYALDTGCVWGGTLSALCVETKERISVAYGETQSPPQRRAAADSCCTMSDMTAS